MLTDGQQAAKMMATAKVKVTHPLCISNRNSRLFFAFSTSSSAAVAVAVLLLLATVGQVQGLWNHSCTIEQMASERKGHVCGPNIPKTLQLVCGRRGTADRNQQQPCRGRRGKTQINE